MKNLLSILFLLMSVFMYGQKVPVMKKFASGKEYKIDLYEACKNKLSEIPISQFAEDVEFIPLETTDDCLIGDACIVSSITQKDIFIFDYERCYHFDRDGKFLNTIGAKGNGPGEYTKPMKCIVDTLNQWVYFPDHWTGRLLKYDYSGNFLEESHPKGLSSLTWLYNPMEFLFGDSFYNTSVNFYR